MSDGRNWTFVIDGPCPECGFDGSEVDCTTVATSLRTAAATYRTLLGRGDIVTRRPSPEVWSALEYGCHVRDVCSKFSERITLMIREDDPEFLNWDEGETAIADRYAEQDPAQVAYDLAVNAGRLADLLDKVHGASWQRPGRRSDGESFTIDTASRYMLHDVLHHQTDIVDGYEKLTDD